MDRLFLDANILFSAAYRADSGLLILWKIADVALCSSRYAVEEARINLDQESQRGRLEKLASRLQLFDASERSLPKDISLPEKDRPILLAAIEARAKYLLTGDIKHFGGYFGQKIEGVTVLAPAEYLKPHPNRG
jgi:predicted nucleic acid-binding protein